MEAVRGTRVAIEDFRNGVEKRNDAGRDDR
jgi:hypothetical protein